METCAECGKPITMEQGSYYARDPVTDIGKSYHSACGDPLGIRQAIAAEREACAKLAEDEAQSIGDGEIYIARKIADAIRART